MDDQQRTKILGGGLALVILVFLLRSTVDGWLRGPIRKLESELAAAEKSAETLQAEELQLAVAKRHLEAHRKRRNSEVRRPGVLGRRHCVGDLGRPSGYQLRHADHSNRADHLRARTERVFREDDS